MLTNALANYLINAAYFSAALSYETTVIPFSAEILSLFKELQESNRVKSLTSWSLNRVQGTAHPV